MGFNSAFKGLKICASSWLLAKAERNVSGVFSPCSLVSSKSTTVSANCAGVKRAVFVPCVVRFDGC